MIMIILFMVFLFPLTLGAGCGDHCENDTSCRLSKYCKRCSTHTYTCVVFTAAYHKVEYGQHCSDSSTRITNRADCQAAAAALGLDWGNGWWGPNDFPGCLHTKDSRNKVYFNYSPHASNDPSINPNYAEICTGSGEGNECGCNGCSCNDALVVTGGDTNLARFRSSELISYMGVCSSPNIPPLPQTTSGGASTWLDSAYSLMFCGGSNRFLGQHGIGVDTTINTCWKLNPGANTWIPSSNMLDKRGWFSLNSVNGGEAVAAGGLDTAIILNSMEKYTGGAWQVLKRVPPPNTPITLNEPTYGHCAVHYALGGHSYLMIIGGSTSTTSQVTPPVTRIDLTTGDTIIVDPGQLPPLLSPACVIDCKKENIYVSGGGMVNGQTSNGVYRYNIRTSPHFTLQGRLNHQRLGHIMGVTTLGQMVVAGGWDYPTLTYLASIESSTDDGVTWNVWSPGLSGAKEYAAMASVPALTFTCQ